MLFSPVRHISVSIDRAPRDVYTFAANPENLPRWAKGLSGAIRNIDGKWIADSPMGRAEVRFTASNALGVLDHEVTLESGETFHNPMRVIANGTGSEVVFTLFRPPSTRLESFDADAAAVERDLRALKNLLELT